MNKLVWPAAGGVGTINEADWKQAVDLSLTTKNQTGDTVLTKQPEGLAFTNDYIKQALTRRRRRASTSTARRSSRARGPC